MASSWRWMNGGPVTLGRIEREAGGLSPKFISEYKERQPQILRLPPPISTPKSQDRSLGAPCAQNNSILMTGTSDSGRWSRGRGAREMGARSRVSPPLLSFFPRPHFPCFPHPTVVVWIGKALFSRRPTRLNRAFLRLRDRKTRRDRKTESLTAESVFSMDYANFLRRRIEWNPMLRRFSAKKSRDPGGGRPVAPAPHRARSAPAGLRRSGISALRAGAPGSTPRPAWFRSG
jgi:hypothetical protein